MKLWGTEFKAICAKTGELKVYGGPNIEALTKSMAQQWCYDHAGHLKITDELISEIPLDGPGLSGIIDYENFQNN